MKIPFVTSDWRRDAAEEPSLKLLNRYFEKNPSNFAEGTSVITRPGFKNFDIGTSLPTSFSQAAYTQEGIFDDNFFVVSNTGAWKCSAGFNTKITPASFTNQSWSYNRGTFTAPIEDTPAYFFFGGTSDLWVYGDDPFAIGTLVVSGNPEDLSQVIIDGIYYQFTTGSVDVGTPDGSSGSPWLVLRGASAAISLQALMLAINAVPGFAGTRFSSLTTKHPSVNANSTTGTTLVVYASTAGLSGTFITTTVAATAVMAWNDGALVIGPDIAYKVPLPFDQSYTVKAVITYASYVLVMVDSPFLFGNVGKFYWIRPGETYVDPLSFATAEISPDSLESFRVLGDNLYLLGRDSTETWYLTGNPDNPFQKMNGGSIRVGCFEGSDVVINNNLFFVAPDFHVYQMLGNSVRSISDNSISERISEFVATGAPNSLALITAIRGWTFTLNDHYFYVIHLGGERVIVYDLTTESWMEWANYNSPVGSGKPINTLLRQHSGILVTSTSSTRTLAIDAYSNNIFEVDQDYRFDFSPDSDDYEPIFCTVTAGVPMRMRETQVCNEVYLIGSVGNPAFYREIAFLIDPDGAILTDADKTPLVDADLFPDDTFSSLFPFLVRLEFSDDNGKTWFDCSGPELEFENYTQEMAWRSLGVVQAPGRIFRISDYNSLIRIDGLDVR